MAHPPEPKGLELLAASSQARTFCSAASWMACAMVRSCWTNQGLAVVRRGLSLGSRRVNSAWAVSYRSVVPLDTLCDTYGLADEVIGDPAGAAESGTPG